MMCIGVIFIKDFAGLYSKTIARNAFRFILKPVGIFFIKAGAVCD